MFPYTEIVEASSALAAAVYLRGERPLVRWGFFSFLVFTVLLETAAYGAVHWMNQAGNVGFYVLYLPVQVSFSAWVLHTNMAAGRKWVRWGTIAFLVFYLVEVARGNFRVYSDRADTIGSLLLVIGCGIYFYELLRDPEPVDLGAHAPFWLAAGIFLFNFGSIAGTLFYDYYGAIYLGSRSLRSIIYFGLTCIFSLCWIHAFRCQRIMNIS